MPCDLLQSGVGWRSKISRCVSRINQGWGDCTACSFDLGGKHHRAGCMHEGGRTGAQRWARLPRCMAWPLLKVAAHARSLRRWVFVCACRQIALFQRPLRHLARASLWALAKQKASPDEAHRLEAEEEACSQAGAGCSKFGGLTRHCPVAVGTEHRALRTGHLDSHDAAAMWHDSNPQSHLAEAVVAATTATATAGALTGRGPATTLACASCMAQLMRVSGRSIGTTRAADWEQTNSAPREIHISAKRV